MYSNLNIPVMKCNYVIRGIKVVTLVFLFLEFIDLLKRERIHLLRRLSVFVNFLYSFVYFMGYKCHVYLFQTYLVSVKLTILIYRSEYQFLLNALVIEKRKRI